MATVTIAAFCRNCKQPGRVQFVPTDGASDGTEIVTCPNCKQKFDAFPWIEWADKLAGHRLPRPTQCKLEPNG